MIAPGFSDLPDVDSELFEQVTDDELALLECYRTLAPQQRAMVLEALVRMVEPLRQPRRSPRAGERAPLQAVPAPQPERC
jgi:hypothetical protein